MLKGLDLTDERAAPRRRRTRTAGRLRRAVKCAATRYNRRDEIRAQGCGHSSSRAARGSAAKPRAAHSPHTADLEVAERPGDLDLPGYRLHPLRGDRAGQWSIRVSANWRIVFRFDGTEAVDVELTDYH